jgi:citrate lyase beta subunit
VPERYRTWLFAPGDRPDRCRKALASAADQVIWDLEDAVAPGHAAEARAALAELLADPEALGGRRPWVRIRSPLTEEGRRDLEELAPHAGTPARWVVPKADGAAVAALEEAVARASRPGEWLFVVESARGLWDLADPGQAGRWRRLGPARLALGAMDLRLELGMTPDPEELDILWARTALVWLSRVHGLPPPVDTPCPALRGPEVAASARRARALGFAGKLVVHPAQVEVVHAAFAPSPEEEAWARAVVAAAERSGGGAVQAAGEMVDRPVVERARAILDRAGEGPT